MSRKTVHSICTINSEVKRYYLQQFSLSHSSVTMGKNKTDGKSKKVQVSKSVSQIIEMLANGQYQ